VYLIHTSAHFLLPKQTEKGKEVNTKAGLPTTSYLSPSAAWFEEIGKKKEKRRKERGRGREMVVEEKKRGWWRRGVPVTVSLLHLKKSKEK